MPFEYYLSVWNSYMQFITYYDWSTWLARKKWTTKKISTSLLTGSLQWRVRLADVLYNIPLILNYIPAKAISSKCFRRWCKLNISEGIRISAHNTVKHNKNLMYQQELDGMKKRNPIPVAHFSTTYKLFKLKNPFLFFLTEELIFFLWSSGINKTESYCA